MMDEKARILDLRKELEKYSLNTMSMTIQV